MDKVVKVFYLWVCVLAELPEDADVDVVGTVAKNCIRKYCTNPIKERTQNQSHSLIGFKYYKLDNINFVEGYPEIQDLTISTYLNIDYSAIHSLNALKKLSIDVLAVDNQEIDFNNFQSLEDLNFNWRKKTINLEKCTNLKSLIISKYKKKDLKEFSKFSNLETLFVWQSSIESLEGIESLANLKRLSLFKNKKLTSLKGLDNLTGLVDLELDECKSLESIEEVKQLKNLKVIKIENCGAVEDFAL